MTSLATVAVSIRFIFVLSTLLKNTNKKKTTTNLSNHFFQTIILEQTLSVKDQTTRFYPFHLYFIILYKIRQTKQNKTKHRIYFHSIFNLFISFPIYLYYIIY